jgi:hypothetical protein
MAYVSVSGRLPVTRRARAFRGVRDFLEAFGAVRRVAGAVESRRRPCAGDLARLGIDPGAFPHL